MFRERERRRRKIGFHWFIISVRRSYSYPGFLLHSKKKKTKTKLKPKVVYETYEKIMCVCMCSHLLSCHTILLSSLLSIFRSDYITTKVLVIPCPMECPYLPIFYVYLVPTTELVWLSYPYNPLNPTSYPLPPSSSSLTSASSLFFFLFHHLGFLL